MTDAERELLRGLIAAAWGLPAQVACGLAIVVGYWMWSRWFFAAIDPVLRHWLGARVGVRIGWVPRGSRAYPNPLDFEPAPRRWYVWTWGIPAEGERTLARDTLVLLLSILFVTVLGGLWPVAVFFFVSFQLKLLSYVVFLPACLLVVGIYGVYWSGRYRVAGER